MSYCNFKSDYAFKNVLVFPNTVLLFEQKPLSVSFHFLIYSSGGIPAWKLIIPFFFYFDCGC